MKKKIAVLISGNGSNLQALIDACKVAAYPARIELVISNKADAYGLARARHAKIMTEVIDHHDFATREAFDRAMHAVLTKRGIEIVCLAGFMRLLSPWFVKEWEGRLLNIHPSLLPEFKGAHAVRDALKAKVKETGCTVHIVTDEMDAGPIVMQSRVPVLSGDTEEILHARIHEQEHKIYPLALKKLIERR